MKPPKKPIELRRLQGRLAYIKKFISNISRRCQHFNKLMKKGVSFFWDQSCQEAFNEVKHYLTNLPVLVALVAAKPFLLYVWAMHNSFWALLAQHNDEGHEHAIYNLSKAMVRAKSRYNHVEKEIFALVFSNHKMWHYLVVQTIQVISKVNPLCLLMTKCSILNERLEKWAIHQS